MIGSRISQYRLALWSGMVVFFVGLGVSGCALLHPQPNATGIPCRDAECALWEEGMDAFRRGDYLEALDIFEDLNRSAGNESLCRKVLYATACTRMILAEDPREFREAMDLWDLWSHSFPPATLDEDPRMLSPLFQYMVPPSTPENDAEEDTTPCDDESCQKAFQLKDKEISRLKKRVRSLEAMQHKVQEKKVKEKPSDETREYQRLLRVREKEILRLKNQLESLEAIHRNIQEKKKKATTP